MRLFIFTMLMLLFGGVVATALQPSLDLVISGWFFDPSYRSADLATHGFYWRDLWAANAIHETAQWGARVLAAVLVIMIIARHQRKAAAFLLVALLVGPGLLTNTVLKDNWGRARPLQVSEFGGSADFTPALQPADQCDKNCAFVSGDGALGFYLHSFFYLAPAVWRRRVFAAGFIGGGIIFGGLRIAMGAHFFSDVLWSGILMLISSAAIHVLFYGYKNTRDAWRSILGQRT